MTGQNRVRQEFQENRGGKKVESERHNEAAEGERYTGTLLVGHSLMAIHKFI